MPGAPHTYTLRIGLTGLSPTIFREDGEESRLHVHAHCADGEAKFWLEPQIELAQNSQTRA